MSRARARARALSIGLLLALTPLLPTHAQNTETTPPEPIVSPEDYFELPDPLRRIVDFFETAEGRAADLALRKEDEKRQEEAAKKFQAAKEAEAKEKEIEKRIANSKEMEKDLRAVEQEIGIVLLPNEEDMEKSRAYFTALTAKKPGDIALEFGQDGRLVTRLMLFGHRKALYELIQEIIKKGTIPGDLANYEIVIVGDPLPNASIQMTGDRIYNGLRTKPRLRVTLGMLAGGEGELAAVIYHEMTHEYRELHEFPEDPPRVKAFLKKHLGKEEIDPQQLEELRADLGAIDRLIQAGYTPYERYYLSRRHAEARANASKTRPDFWTKLEAMLGTHPEPEVRMSLVKAYVNEIKGKAEGLSDATGSGVREFTGNLAILSARARIYKWWGSSKLPRRMINTVLASAAIYGVYVAQDAGLFSGLIHHVGDGVGAAKDTIGDYVRPAVDTAGSGLAGGMDWAFRNLGKAVGWMSAEVYEGLQALGGPNADGAEGLNWRVLSRYGLYAATATPTAFRIYDNLKTKLKLKLYYKSDLALAVKHLKLDQYLERQAMSESLVRRVFLERSGTPKNPDFYVRLFKFALIQARLAESTINNPGFKYWDKRGELTWGTADFKRFEKDLGLYSILARNRDYMNAILDLISEGALVLPKESVRQIGALLEREAHHIKGLADEPFNVVDSPGITVETLATRSVQEALGRFYDFARERHGLAFANAQKRLVGAREFRKMVPGSPMPRKALDLEQTYQVLNAGKQLGAEETLRLIHRLFDEGQDYRAAELARARFAELTDFMLSPYARRVHADMYVRILRSISIRVGNLPLLPSAKTQLDIYDAARARAIAKGPAMRTAWTSIENRVKGVESDEYPEGANYAAKERADRAKLRDKLLEIDLRWFDDYLRSLDTLAKLRDFVVELESTSTRIESFRDRIVESVISRADHLLRTVADIEMLLATENLWHQTGDGTLRFGKLEEAFKASMTAMIKEYPEQWKYHPNSSEILHALIVQRLRELGAFPVDFEARRILWNRLVNRGVTSVTDGLFAELYDEAIAQGADPGKLRQLILDLSPEPGKSGTGKIWEPQMKKRVFLDQLRLTPVYRDALAKDPELRQSEIAELIKRAGDEFPLRGEEYKAVLEALSRELKTSSAESRTFTDAKENAGRTQQELGVRYFNSLNATVHSWTVQEQWEFILYLRGDKEATPLIKESFSTVGPARIRRMYQLLPELLRAAAIDGFLDSPRGILKSLNMNQPNARKILAYVLRDSDAKTREVATDLLEAFLYSIEKAGHAPYKAFVLSYLLAQSKGKTSGGRALRNVLEIFGVTGVKIGQFIAAAGVLPEEDTRELRGLQEQAQVPDRDPIYEDIRNITGGEDLPARVRELLGAASMKYAMLAEDLESMKQFVIKIQRETTKDVGSEFTQAEHMAEYLMSKKGRKYAILKAIVRASRKAVEREQSLGDEAIKSRTAAEKIYRGLLDVEVPREVLVDVRGQKRMLISEFASGSSIHELPLDHRELVAKRILQIEGDNLFSDQDVIWFDPDRHAGNFRTAVEAGLGIPRVMIRPIDFGQLLKITRAERDQILDLFTLAQALRLSGANTWGATRIGEILGLNATQVAALRPKLALYFPSQGQEEITAYFSVLSALDEAGLDPKIEFFDFIRAIIQLNQYQDYVKDGAFELPSTRLKKEIELRATRYTEEHIRSQMTVGEKIKFKIGAWKAWIARFRKAPPELPAETSPVQLNLGCIVRALKL